MTRLSPGAPWDTRAARREALGEHTTDGPDETNAPPGGRDSGARGGPGRPDGGTGPEPGPARGTSPHRALEDTDTPDARFRGLSAVGTGSYDTVGLTPGHGCRAAGEKGRDGHPKHVVCPDRRRRGYPFAVRERK
ncbi:hypothetical protein [Streptomyces sp. NPDC059781]|uniref:hypothetical protein n=1 Tax=Streptomyces sp. NPDC059781 TaxID=3346943 RepID=UPI00365A6B2F